MPYHYISNEVFSSNYYFLFVRFYFSKPYHQKHTAAKTKTAEIQIAILVWYQYQWIFFTQQNKKKCMQTSTVFSFI